MLCWALKANFTNCSRFTTEESSFHDMPAERPRNEVKTVTHVYAQGVTHVRAPCREEGHRVQGEPPGCGVSDSADCHVLRSILTKNRGLHPLSACRGLVEIKSWPRVHRQTASEKRACRGRCARHWPDYKCCGCRGY